MTLWGLSVVTGPSSLRMATQMAAYTTAGISRFSRYVRSAAAACLSLIVGTYSTSSMSLLIVSIFSRMISIVTSLWMWWAKTALSVASAL